MLEELRIQRFKNINDISMKLDKINVLVGANNSGKSSILQALQFAVSVSQTTQLINNVKWKTEKNLTKNIIPTNNRLTTSVATTQLVYSPLRDINGLAPNGILKRDINHAISICLKEKRTNNTTNIYVTSGHHRNISIEIIGKDLGEKLQDIEKPYSIFVTGLAGIPNAEEYKTPGIVRKAAARGDSNNVFRNILLLLHENQSNWDKFTSDFHEIFPNLNINVNFNPNYDEFINATIQIENNKLPIDAAGTGVLQAIQILSYINIYNPKILILDEPDSHLHPNNQRSLARTLVKLADQRNLQIIISTHSRHLLDELSNDAKVHWIRNGLLVDEDSYDNIGLLMDIGALDKGERLLNGNVKCVLLTEDSDPQPISILAESSGFNMNEVEIWSYKGCSKKDIAIYVAKFISDHAPTTKILLHRDRDYLTDEEITQFINEIEKYNINCFITEGTDVESHFICDKLIHELYPSITLNRAQEIIEEAINESEEKSIEKFINSRTNIEYAKYNKNSQFKRPNVGKMTFEIQKQYSNNKLRYMHGKSVLKRIKDILQREVHNNVNLFISCNCLKNEKLSKFSSELWEDKSNKLSQN
jgi:energy-coupling factor transporter ATP-binding protein EcfA2